MKCVHGGQVWSCTECARIMKEPQWPTWLVDYNFEGKLYSMHVVARDADEAKRRLSACANFGQVKGELLASVPASRGGFLVPLVVWFRNAFSRG